MVHVSRRKLLQLAAVAPSALPAAWMSLASAAAGTKTLTAVMQSDLRVTDPGAGRHPEADETGAPKGRHRMSSPIRPDAAALPRTAPSTP